MRAVVPHKFSKCSFKARISIASLSLLAIAFAFAPVGFAQTSVSPDLTQANIEDLMNIHVTSVNKRDQVFSRAGAAIYVITQEDIRRSGATNIPDLLRVVPGVEVAQVNANRWAVSIRGFNSIYANKVLLLIDGRSVYNSTSSSVFWDQEQVPLEDIERIEVIRGPGGTLWGANAVNGIINIITMNAAATKSVLLRAGTGSKQTADGLVQYGGNVGNDEHYRIFGRYFNTESMASSKTQPTGDGWHGSQIGFRSDWNLSNRDSLTFEAEGLETTGGETVTDVVTNAIPLQGTFADRMNNTTWDVLTQWDHRLKNGSDVSLRAVYDFNHRDAMGPTDESHQTADLDFQHHMLLGSRNDLVWGFDYRLERSHFRPGWSVEVLPPRSTTSLFSTFVQDEIALTNFVSLTFGSKFEHNAYTGFEYEPSAQLQWSPTSHQILWASAARAIRQPSHVDFGLVNDAAVVPLSNGGFGVVTVFGSPQVKAEQLRDYEIGYRTMLNKTFSLDVAGFWSFYRNLETNEPQASYFSSRPVPHLVIPLVFSNQAHARSYGTELFLNWELTGRWRVSPGYSWLHLTAEADPSSRDSTIGQLPGRSPKHHFEIRSLYTLRRNMDWDTGLQYVSDLATGAIPSYVRLDTRLGWKVGESTELSVAGQNLLSPHHFEFSSMFGIDPTQVDRSVVGKITWRF